MAVSIRGNRGHLRIIEDGQAVELYEITQFSFREDAQSRKSHYVGQNDPETDKLLDGWSGQLALEVKTGLVDELMQRFNDASDAGVTVPTIVLMLYVEYPNLTSGTYVFSGVTIMYDGYQQSGSQEKITKTISFIASNMRYRAS